MEEQQSISAVCDYLIVLLYMIHDFNAMNTGDALEADLCLIGSGAAGITIAREFANTQTSVLLVEGGARTFESSSQEPYQCDVIGLPYAGWRDGRARVLGGSTTLWAGQALPLFDIDFERRDWVPHSGWPISRADLISFYKRAEQVMQIPSVTYGLDTWPKMDRPPGKVDDPIATHFSQFAAVPNFATMYRQQLADSENVTVLTNATVVRLEATENAQYVRTASIKSPEGKMASVAARVFVICCGGIDTPRLLLASDSVQAGGLGNGYDVVGRYYQDHPTFVVPVVLRRPEAFRRWYSTFRHKSAGYAVKLTPTAELQRKLKMLNVGAEATFPAPVDDPIASARRLLHNLRRAKSGTSWRSDLVNVARQPRKLLYGAYRRYIRGLPSLVSPTSELIVSGEQEPNASSRITLSSKQDSLGMRRAVIDWQLTETVTVSFEKFLRLLDTYWSTRDIADIEIEKLEVTGREVGRHGGYMDVYHHLGATRMGTDRTTSVVDPSCRVHGVDNLYVGSSSVFPTGGFSNPTLTLLALCLRMADQIKLRLPTSSSVSGE